MSIPPRLETIFERNKPLTYFVTWSTKNRVPVLANPEYHQALLQTIAGANRWEIECGIIMPDHVHLLASPFHRDESISNLVTYLKRNSRSQVNGKWKWQEGFFDHLLRSDESAEQKWKYIRDNPVRAGLVKNWNDWPYRIKL